MYLDYVVDIPDVKGKITFRTKGQARYVYYEYSREYDPSKQYTNVKRLLSVRFCRKMKIK